MWKKSKDLEQSQQVKKKEQIQMLELILLVIKM